MDGSASPFAKARHALLPIEERSLRLERRRKQLALAGALDAQVQQQAAARQQRQQKQLEQDKVRDRTSRSPVNEQSLRRSPRHRAGLPRHGREPIALPRASVPAAESARQATPPQQRPSSPPGTVEHNLSTTHDAGDKVQISAAHMRRLEQMMAIRNVKDTQLEQELDHITQGLTDVAQQQAVQAEGIQSLAQQVTAAVAKTAQLSDKQLALEDHLELTARQHDRMYAEIQRMLQGGHVEQGSTHLSGEVEALKRQIGEITQTTPPGQIRRDEGALEELRAHIDTGAHQIRGLQQHVASVGEELHRVVSSFTRLEERIDKSQQHTYVADHDGVSVVELHRSLAQLRADFHKVLSSVDNQTKNNAPRAPHWPRE